MWKQAGIKLKSLLYDDSGVAMAYTVLTSLFIFMLCVSAYAMSENIRQKMELQNACDAAAYSGAVVQADMLSRLAVLNRALSWTYIETNKRQMDATVDDWLQRVVPRDERLEVEARAVNASGNCGFGVRNGDFCVCPIGQRGVCWFAGIGNTPGYVALNGQNVSVDHIRIAMGRAYPVESDNILNGYENIAILNDAINNIRNSINPFINAAVDRTMRRMTAKSGSGVLFGCHLDGKWDNTAPPSYILPQRDEERFINYAGTTSQRELDRGNNVWWNLVSTVSGWGSGGFARNYSGGELRARGEARAKRHIHTYSTFGSSHICGTTWTREFHESGRVLFSSTPARPAVLDPGFFGASGTVLVAAKCKTGNPLSAWLGADAANGVFSAFNGTGRDMWALSTARAGVRLGAGAADSDDEGAYRILFPGDRSSKPKYSSGNGTWNLCEDDWDAVMIPVNRAWHDASQGEWVGTPSAESILASVKSHLAPDTVYQNGIGNFMRH